MNDHPLPLDLVTIDGPLAHETLRRALEVARQAGSPERPAAAMLAAWVLPRVTPDERTLSDAWTALAACLDEPVAFHPLLRGLVRADHANPERMAPALARLAARAFTEDRRQQLFWLVSAMLVHDATAQRIDVAWGERAFSAVPTSDRAWARAFGQWFQRFPEGRACLVSCVRANPRVSAELTPALVRSVHELAPTVGGWWLLAGLRGKQHEGLPCTAKEFGAELPEAIATLEEAIVEAEGDAAIRLRLARWRVEIAE